MAKTYKSKALAAAHENISDLYRLGLIDKKTMRKFDAACLAPVPKVTPVAVRSSRRKGGVSQGDLAARPNRKRKEQTR
jgi:putative transcriptional regulator